MCVPEFKFKLIQETFGRFQFLYFKRNLIFIFLHRRNQGYQLTTSSESATCAFLRLSKRRLVPRWVLCTIGKGEVGNLALYCALRNCALPLPGLSQWPVKDRRGTPNVSDNPTFRLLDFNNNSLRLSSSRPCRKNRNLQWQIHSWEHCGSLNPIAEPDNSATRLACSDFLKVDMLKSQKHIDEPCFKIIIFVWRQQTIPMFDGTGIQSVIQESLPFNIRLHAVCNLVDNMTGSPI